MKRLVPVLLAAACLLSACRHTVTFEAVEEKDIALDSERRLLAIADKECEIDDKGGYLYEDKLLEAYLNSVAKLLLTHATRTTDKQIVVKVFRDPERNAAALPNGRMYINTGILAAMDNEAQLAGVLGHEMTHVIRRHAARGFTSMKKRSMSETGRGSLRRILTSHTFYSRTLESEADREGLSMMAAAGYDPGEFVAGLEVLKRHDEMDKRKANAAYGGHPAIMDRIRSATELVSREYRDKEGKKNADRFLAVTARLLLDNAELDLKQANYAFAREAIEKYLRREQNNPRAYYLLGELYREKGKQYSEEKSRESYRKALALNAGYADAYRGLGMLEFGAGRKAEAKINFQHYLDLQPAAADREYIKQYIRASK